VAGDALEERVAAAVIPVPMAGGRSETIKDLRVHTGVGIDESEAGHDLNARAGGPIARRRQLAGAAPVAETRGGAVRTALGQAAGAIAASLIVGIVKSVLPGR